MQRIAKLSLIGIISALLLPSHSALASQQWELINPAGIQYIEPVTVLPHDQSLEGKTVLLRWNGKPNGDVVLERLAELLSENIKDVNIVKMWYDYPDSASGSTMDRTGSWDKDFIAAIQAVGPDLVIASQAD